MKFNKRLASSSLALMLALASTNLPVIAADNESSEKSNIEETVDSGDVIQEDTDEVFEKETEASESIVETADNYSLIVDESTGKITGYVDNVEPVYSSNGFLQNPQDLVIPSNVNGVKITGIADEAFIGWERLGSVELEEGIEYVGVSAFQDCGNLETVSIPDTLTYIDEYAFYDAKFLDKLVFGENPQLAVINYMAFAGCCFEEVTIPASVTNIHEKAFRNCKYLEKVYFEGDAPQNLEEDENAFSNCSPNLVFYFYEGKTGYTTPTWLGHKCLMITTSISDYNLIFDKGTGRITGYIDNIEAVYNNGFLQNPQDLIIPSVIDGTKVTGIDIEAFMGWERLGSVTIEDGVEYIGVSAFQDCGNLETVSIPDTLTYMDEYAFYDAKFLDKLIFGENPQLAVINYMSFAGCGFEEVTIPASVTNIHEKAFRNCKYLEKVYFEGNAPQNLEEDENAFSNCSPNLVLYFYEGKTGYTTPTWINHKCQMISKVNSDYSLIFDKSTGKITGYLDNLESVFEDGVLQNPQDLIIPSSIDGTKVIGIDEEAFAEWERLGSITIENGVEYIGMYAFEKCSNVKSVIIPNTLIGIDGHAFDDTVSLENVTFEKVSKLEYIDYMAFSNSGISEIVIPESVNAIHDNAFLMCKNLSKVYFEGDAPNYLEEDENAFNWCSPDLVLYFYEGKTGFTTPTWIGHKCVMIKTSTGGWDFSNPVFNSLGTISSNVTIDNLTILANSENPVQVKENSRTLDGVKYDYCLSLRGKGNTNYRAVKLEVSGNCTIDIAAASNSDTRSLVIAKKDGTVVGTVPAGVELTMNSVEYTGDTDSLYIYSEKDNVNIYAINVNYN